MSEYVAFRDGGKTSENGLNRPFNKLYTPGYITGWAASQRGAGANMSVDISIGDGYVARSTDDYGYYAWSDAVKNVVVTTADATNPRLDILVAYIDKSVVQSATSDNIGALVFAIIAGTPAGSPSAPSAGTIQSTIGASNPYIQIARIAVAASASSIVNANITDLRTQITSSISTSIELIIDAIYPIGSIYTNASVSTNPGTLLGYGTWAAFGAGKVMVGLDSGQTEFDTLEETGGAKTHTLSSGEMPSHTHTQDAHSHTLNRIEVKSNQNFTGTGNNPLNDAGAATGYASTSSVAATNQNTGGGGAHNNLQPYIVVYMWKRTA
jgi:microcystin-dependent protein